MKIFSTTSAAALLLGVSAIMHSAPASAMLPEPTCAALAQECAAGNQQACQIYKLGCLGKSSPGSTVLGAPPARHSDKLHNASIRNDHALAAAN